MAVVDLDNVPSWWRRAKSENMTAAEARRLAGTAGGAPQVAQAAHTARTHAGSTPRGLLPAGALAGKLVCDYKTVCAAAPAALAPRARLQLLGNPRPETRSCLAPQALCGC